MISKVVFSSSVMNIDKKTCDKHKLYHTFIVFIHAMVIVFGNFENFANSIGIYPGIYDDGPLYDINRREHGSVNKIDKHYCRIP